MSTEQAQSTPSEDGSLKQLFVPGARLYLSEAKIISMPAHDLNGTFHLHPMSIGSTLTVIEADDEGAVVQLPGPYGGKKRIVFSELVQFDCEFAVDKRSEAPLSDKRAEELTSEGDDPVALRASDSLDEVRRLTIAAMKHK